MGTETENDNSPKLQFPDDRLPPIEDLEAIATITEADVDAAVNAWENDPPDEKYKLLLKATEMEQ